MQGRVSVDVNRMHITIGIQEQHSDIHTAWECCPVKADILFLAHKVPKDRTKYYFVKNMSNTAWVGLAANLVPDADVGSFGQKQLHLVHVFVFCCPDHGGPASIILINNINNTFNGTT